mgnify:CR=1 FL=1
MLPRSEHERILLIANEKYARKHNSTGCEVDDIKNEVLRAGGDMQDVYAILAIELDKMIAGDEDKENLN